MSAASAWCVSHPEIILWAALSMLGALAPSDSRIGALARRWASDLRGPPAPPAPPGASS